MITSSRTVMASSQAVRVDDISEASRPEKTHKHVSINHTRSRSESWEHDGHNKHLRRPDPASRAAAEAPHAG